jgi:hypothetical protein
MRHPATEGKQIKYCFYKTFLQLVGPKQIDLNLSPKTPTTPYDPAHLSRERQAWHMTWVLNTFIALFIWMWVHGPFIG